MDKPLVKISDINLASTLLTLGFNILGTDDLDPTRVYFYFDDTQAVKETIDLYWRNELKVNPQSFSYSRREVLSRIHQKTGGPDKGNQKY